MPKQNLDGGELAALVAAGYKYSELAKQFGVTVNTIVGKVDYYRRTHDAYLDEDDLPGKPPELSGDYMVVGDVHLPHVDWGFAALVGRVARRHGLTKLIVAGDFLDAAAFSTYPRVMRPAAWKRERDAARALVGEWVQQFDSILFLMGNHERRLQRWTMGELDQDDIFSMVTTSPKCTYTQWGWCIVRSGAQDWRVTHARNYSLNPLTVADSLAQKFQSHVIDHHEHKLAQGLDRYGRYVIVNNGGLFDPSKLLYTRLDDNKSPVMAQGFTRLQNGTATLYGKSPFTDWSGIV